MGATRIAFTPLGDSQVVLDFAAARGFSRFAGGPAAIGAQHVSRGGVPYRVVWDTWQEYDVELRAIRPTSKVYFFERLWAWWSFAISGGVFALSLDQDQTGDTVLSSQLAQAGTSLVIPSSAGFGGGDWIYLEAANDVARFCRAQVRTVPDTTHLTLINGSPFTFPAGSTVRHAEHFPKCIVTSTEVPFKERDGDRGAGLWDLAFSIRTTR